MGCEEVGWGVYRKCVRYRDGEGGYGVRALVCRL